MGFPGITNYQEAVPGSTVTACMAVRDATPNDWTYSLWDENDELISTGTLPDLPAYVKPDQVARIAFLLDIEYARVV